MLEKTITYKDLDGNDRTETFRFHMNHSEVVEWIVSNGNYTLDKVLLKISEERNARDVVNVFKDLIRRSYGEKTLDGRGFVKTEEIWNKFYYTEAYSQLFMELISDAKKASDFFNAIIPTDLSQKIQDLVSNNPDAMPDYLKDLIDKNQNGNNSAADIIMMPLQ